MPVTLSKMKVTQQSVHLCDWETFVRGRNSVLSAQMNEQLHAILNSLSSDRTGASPWWQAQIAATPTKSRTQQKRIQRQHTIDFLTTTICQEIPVMPSRAHCCCSLFSFFISSLSKTHFKNQCLNHCPNPKYPNIASCGKA